MWLHWNVIRPPTTPVCLVVVFGLRSAYQYGRERGEHDARNNEGARPGSHRHALVLFHSGRTVWFGGGPRQLAAAGGSEEAGPTRQAALATRRKPFDCHRELEDRSSACPGGHLEGRRAGRARLAMAAEEDEASEDAFGEGGSDDGSEDEGEEGEEGEDESEDGSDWTYETEDSELSDEEFQSNVNGGWPVAPHGPPAAVLHNSPSPFPSPHRNATSASCAPFQRSGEAGATRRRAEASSPRRGFGRATQCRTATRQATSS